MVVFFLHLMEQFFG